MPAMGLLVRLKSFLRNKLAFHPDAHARKSYSQEGEDLLLSRIFAGQTTGFYVDVGAHHPHRFSNTQLFYERGWSGINIEPNPDGIHAFRSARPRDINLELGISDQPASLTYYYFDDPALNTFDAAIAKSRESQTPYRIIKTMPVQVERLGDVMEKHLPAGTTIDFLSIDVEGRDFAVLQSNDWNRFRPSWVLVEALGTTLEEVMESEIARFMKSNRYILFAKTYNTLFFQSRTSALS
jgi:FkbM family methyltransferase